MAEARIDKWMWAARIFKTRTIAAEACKKGRVCINGAQAKPARMIKVGDVIQVKKPPITYSFKVLQAIEKRVGAKLVPDVMENVTTPDQYELLEMSKISGFVNRAKGTGRRRRKTDAIWTTSLLLNTWTTSTSILTAMTKTEMMKNKITKGRIAPKLSVLCCFYAYYRLAFIASISS